MNIDDKKLKEILIKESYVTEEEIGKAEKFAKEHKTSISEYLLTEGLINKDLLGQAMAESFGVPYANLKATQPKKEQILKIPEELAKKYNLILFSEKAKELIVATDKPDQKEISSELKKIFPSKKIKINYALTEDIQELLVDYKKPLETRFSQIIESNTRVAPEILDEIFSDAYTFHTSDIHFEPQADVVVVRFRVDGVLQEAGRIKREYYENILNRIKVQSHLRIDEHFSAQDGSMRFEKDGKVFDLRTSIVPTVEGEKIVLRILAAYIQGFTLSDLGLSPENQEILKKSADKPFGMILVTGPTGSGKTTTLYAVLKLLHNPEVNITTIEDPVEYKILGVNQIQVNQETELTFSRGLRSIVRQDPDIILVGEIRDEETAEISVNAALTGHLLLSTFHANDAATAIPRLLDMKVEPFLLASTLDVVIAQRLVRKICTSCKHSVSISKKEVEDKYPFLKEYYKASKDKLTLYKGKGCNMCSGTGFSGRTAVFEFIKMTPELQDLVLNNPSAKEIWELAKKQGAVSMFEDGLQKVKNGDTTIDELMRVAPPER